MTDNTARVLATTIPTAPKLRTTNRKIGTTTFIVSSSFSDKGNGDIISKIARLIQNDTTDSAKN